MNETVAVGVIGGLCTLLAAMGSAWFVYRRAVRVELVKNEQDTEIRLIDKWKEYSAELASVKKAQDKEILDLKTKNHDLEADLRGARREIDELRGIVESQSAKLDLQAAQLAKLERRFNDLDEEGVIEE